MHRVMNEKMSELRMRPHLLVETKSFVREYLEVKNAGV